MIFFLYKHTANKMDEDYEKQKFYDIDIIIMKSTGYVNATKICHKFGKDIYDWTRTSSNLIMGDLAKKLKVDPSALKILKNNGKRELWGTYVHPTIAIHVICWCSRDINLLLFDDIWKLRNVNKTSITVPNVSARTKSTIRTGIYLVRIGSVKDLRIHLDIPNNYDDDYNVYKYGASFNILRRIRCHEKTYSFTENIKPELVYSQSIEYKLRFKAEYDLENAFKNFGIHFTRDGYKELVIFSLSKSDEVKALFDAVGSNYKRK